MRRKNKISISGKTGMVLAELIVALTLTAFFTLILFQVVQSLHQYITRWDRSVRMRQMLSASLFSMCRDVRMTGCNPIGTIHVDPFEKGSDPDGSGISFQLRMDKRGSKPGSRPDGDIQDPDERIQYRWDFEEGVLRRNGQPLLLGIREGTGAMQPFSLIEKNGKEFLNMVLTLEDAGEIRSLSTSVYLRNPS